MSCNHLYDCIRCGGIVDELEMLSADQGEETARLRALVVKIKDEWVLYHDWGQNPLDTLRKIEHLTACALDPAPNAGVSDTGDTDLYHPERQGDSMRRGEG